MGKKQAIVYFAEKGFIDLTAKSKLISVTEHRKLQKLQMQLRFEAKKFNTAKVRTENASVYQELQLLFADLQKSYVKYGYL